MFHAFLIGEKHLVKKETNAFFFRLNYGSAANQNMFADKVDTQGI